ncbi:MAG: tyrosine-protein phosphatase [Defluviitaleaceae bacterium]|nr:tyrosine-protein phosphatase [Defluviitaleaceae bacterium]
MKNFRDLGGIKTACGKTVRKNRLLRAAQPVGLSAEDVKKLREYDLKFIVDFRTHHEVTNEPVDEIEGVTYTHIDIMGENAAQAADPNYWMKLFLKNPKNVVDEFTKTYQEFAASPSSIAGYSAFIKACAAANEGATLFHCAAGRDRTGFAAAIILKLLNVSDENIYEDYQKTKAYQAEVHAYWVARSKEYGLTDEQAEALEIVFHVNNAYLQAAYNSAEEIYGSFENYVTQGLKIRDEEIKRLREIYLE